MRDEPGVTGGSGTGGLGGLGPRVRERPPPRLSIALAAAGCALVVLGALLVGGDGLGDSGLGGDDGSRWPGILASAAVVGGGLALLTRTGREGPLATAGTVAAALGIPPLVLFATLDQGNVVPYSADAVLVLSTMAWTAGFLAGPARSRPFLLGAAAVGAWLALLQLTEDLFDLPFNLVASLAVAFDPEATGEAPFASAFPDPSVLGGLSLAVGAGYLLLARRWDAAGLRGAATPLLVASIAALAAGVAFLTDELEAAGAGLLGAVVGALVAAHGAAVGRRGTTWAGATISAVGLVAFVGDLTDDATGGGIALAMVGAGVVAGAEALRRATGEPPEVDERPVALNPWAPAPTGEGDLHR